MSAPEAADAMHIPYPTYKSHENGSRGARKEDAPHQAGVGAQAHADLLIAFFGWPPTICA